MAKPMPDLDPDFGSDSDLETRELNDLLGGSPARGTHPRPELLLACEQGVLPPEAQLQVRQHLDRCALCTMLVADLATLPEAELTPAQFDRIGARLPVASARAASGKGIRLIASIAAVLALCVFATFALRHREQPQAVAHVAPAPPAAVVAALEIPLRPLAPPSPDATDLLTRGAHQGNGSQGNAPSIAQLLPAFDAYNKSDYKTAAARLAPLAQTYPRSRLVRLYLAVSQLYLKQDREAFAGLALLRAARPLDADAVWYSAIAAQRLRYGETRTLLQSLCADGKSAYAAESCRIAPTL